MRDHKPRQLLLVAFKVLIFLLDLIILFISDISCQKGWWWGWPHVRWYNVAWPIILISSNILSRICNIHQKVTVMTFSSPWLNNLDIHPLPLPHPFPETDHNTERGINHRNQCVISSVTRIGHADFWTKETFLFLHKSLFNVLHLFDNQWLFSRCIWRHIFW